jgi:polyisoprenoid-binding protein YceI
MRTYGPETARCEVVVLREGVLSAVGHDLLLRVGAFELAVDGEARVSARLDAASLRVVTALRDGRELPGALSPADVREIEASIASSVLSARRFPEIRFESSSVARQGDGYAVSGALTLAGATRPISFTVRRGAGRLVAEVPVDQPAFGIRPFRAMLGALRVRREVRVRASIPADGP